MRVAARSVLASVALLALLAGCAPAGPPPTTAAVSTVPPPPITGTVVVQPQP